MLVTDILARLRTDNSQFKSGMSQATSSLKDFQNETNHAGGALRGMMAVAGMAGTAATAALGAASTALMGLGMKGLQGTAAMEQLKISMVGLFEAAGKSADDAYGFLERLQKFAATTPFEFPELAETSKRLMAVGYNGDQVIDMLSTMGNAAAAAGKGSDSVIRLANALQRVKGTGRLTGETIMMMSDAMPTFNARGAIAAELYGGDMTAAMKALESGTVDADKAIGALMAGMKKLQGAEGAMERQSKTLLGIMSTFKDEVNMAMVRGLEPALPALESALVKMIEPVSEFTKDFGKALGPALANLTNAAAPALIELAKVLGPVLANLISVMGPTLQGLLPVLSAVVKMFGDFLGKIIKPLGVLMNYLAPIILNFTNALGTQLLNALNALLPAAYPLTMAFVNIMNALMPLVPVIVQLALAVTPLITYFALFIANTINLAQQAGILVPILKGLFAAFVAMKIIGVLTGLQTAYAAAIVHGSVMMSAATGKMKAMELATLGYTKTAKLATLAQNLLNGSILKNTVALAKNVVGWVAKRIATAAATIATIATTVAEWALNVALLANPFVLIVVAIIAFVAAIVLAYQKVEWFHKFVDGAWEGIKNVISGVVSWLTKAVPAAFEWIKNAFLKYTPLGIIISHWDKIKEYFMGLPAKFIEFGKNIIQGLVNGVGKLKTMVLNKIKEVVMGPVDKIKEWLGIKSPSKVTHKIGQNFGQGYVNGIKSKQKAAGDAAAAMGEHSGTRLAEGIREAVMSATYAVGEHGGTMLRNVLTNESAIAQDVDKPKPKPTGAGGAAKRLADIYVFGKLMGKNYGKGFADGYKTVRSATENAVGVLKDAAQNIVNSAQDVADSLKDFGSMISTAVPENAFMTADGYLQSMQQRLDMMGEFAAALSKLQKMKLNKTIFGDIAKAGPIAGMQMAQTLLEGGQKAIDQLNAMQSKLDSAARTGADVYTMGMTGKSLAYAEAQAGMTVNFTKDAINISVGKGASAADAAEIRKVVIKAINDALALATRQEKAG